MTGEDRDDLDALAAGYALGTAPDRDALGRRMDNDPAFAALVAEWEARLAPLNNSYAEVPAPHLLPNIEKRLFGYAPRRWRWPVFGALAAASLAAVLVLMPVRDDSIVARLDSPDQAVVVQATYSPSDRVLRLEQLVGPDAPAGSSYEGWVILPDQAPVSIGVLEGRVLQAVPERVPTGTTIAITLEPAGGAPDGQPTGPVILSAMINI